jgi:hypothetical protein
MPLFNPNSEAELWRQASLPDVEPWLPARRKETDGNRAHKIFPILSRNSPSFPGGKDAALHVRQGCLTPPTSEFGFKPKVNWQDAARSPVNQRCLRQVLECASPLALWRSWAVESARGLAYSKTLTRPPARRAKPRIRGSRREVMLRRRGPVMAGSITN